jgi:quinol monooxygenase YgiN
VPKLLRYASQAASDSHLATQPVKDLIELFTTGDVLAGAPEVHIAPIVVNKLARTAPSISDNPAIVLSNFEYKPGTLENAIKGWKSVVDYVSAKEDGTKSYTILADLEKGKEIRTVEVYQSWDYMENVHLKSPVIASNVEQNGKDRTGVKGAVRVKLVDGFLGREKLGKL